MSEYYGVTRSDEYLAHYGIKGMKWGVRKAIESGSARRLDRQFRKAEKKLAKLKMLGSQDNKSKYIKRAALYGSGAAMAGTAAALGTEALAKASKLRKGFNGRLVKNPDTSIGNKIAEWGRRSGTDEIGGRMAKLAGGTSFEPKPYERMVNNGKGWVSEGIVQPNDPAHIKALRNTSNNTYARIGAGLLGAGLGVAAARNAYRASTVNKHAKQAKEFETQMRKSFAGTKYANKVGKSYKAKTSGTKYSRVKHDDLNDPNALAHYGIKGMKWGVRKAIEKGDERKLAKHYQKASFKLAKLNRDASDLGLLDHQNKADKYGRRAVRALIGTGIAGALTAGNTSALNRMTEVRALGTNHVVDHLDPRIAGMFMDEKGRKALNGLRNGRQLTGALTALNAGRTLYNAGKSAYHRYKNSPSGHAAAVAKRDAFKAEMDKAFAGTKYGKKKRK